MTPEEAINKATEIYKEQEKPDGDTPPKIFAIIALAEFLLKKEE